MSSSLVIPACAADRRAIRVVRMAGAGRDTNIVAWGLKHVAAWTYIYATSIAGLWLLVPWYVPHILMVLSISLAARTLPGAFRLWHPPENRRRWLALATRAGATVIGVGTLWVAVQGRTPAERNAGRSHLPSPIRALLHRQWRQHGAGKRASEAVDRRAFPPVSRSRLRR